MQAGRREGVSKAGLGAEWPALWASPPPCGRGAMSGVDSSVEAQPQSRAPDKAVVSSNSSSIPACQQNGEPKAGAQKRDKDERKVSVVVWSGGGASDWDGNQGGWGCVGVEGSALAEMPDFTR